MKHDLKDKLGFEFTGSRAKTWTLMALTGSWLALAGTGAGAHPGHGLAEAGAAHAITSPHHLAQLSLLAVSALALGLALALASRLIQKPRARRAMQAVAGCSLVLAAALWLR